MKFISRQELIRNILVLRYHSMVSDCKTVYMKYSVIARLVDKSVTFVRYICMDHEQLKKKPKVYNFRKK